MRNRPIKIQLHIKRKFISVPCHPVIIPSGMKKGGKV